MKEIEKKEKVSTHTKKNKDEKKIKIKTFPGLSGSGDPQRLKQCISFICLQICFCRRNFVFHLIFYVFCFPSKKVHWKLIREAPNSSETAKESLSVQQLGDIQSKVGFLRIWPSIATGTGPNNSIADFFRHMKGVVLQTFGTGNAPSDGISECINV